MHPLRNAIVGLGRIGSTLENDHLREKPCTHAGAVSRSPDCILVGGCDIDEKKRARFKNRWRCESVYPSAGTLLRKTRPHILHIATPPDTHLHMVEKAVQYGVFVCICEKPLAATLADAKRIAEIHESGRIKVLTNHERRYSADYMHAKTLVSEKTLGPLRAITAKISMENEQCLSAMLWNDGTHLVDIIRYLCCSRLEPEKLFGTLENKNETAHILARSENVPVLIEVGGGRDHYVFELDLGLASGRIRIGNGLYEEYRSEKSPYYEGFNSLKRMNVPCKDPKQWPCGPTGFFTHMLEDAVLCARQNTEPVSSAKDGFLALWFIDRVFHLLKS
jgi:predicted dehydrogenase